MTIIEALAILDQASARAAMTRGDHMKVQQALAVLKENVTDEED